MRISKSTITIFLMLLLWSNAIYSQISLSGKVVDPDQKPLAGATILLKNTYTGTVSNADGKFKISVSQPDSVTLVISFLGFTTQEQTIDLQSNKENLTITLVPKSIKMDKELVILAQTVTKETPIAFQNIDSQYLANRNMGVDLPILLEGATSVVSTSDAGNGVGYSGMRIRGSDATRVNVTINGIPLNDPESQGTFFVNLPDLTSSADDIQIQRGVGTSANGAGAFGGSVNINTTDLREEAYGQYSFGNGSFNTYKNSLMFGTGLLKSGFAFDGRLSSIKSDGYIDRASSDLKSYYAKAGYYGSKFSAKFITFGGLEKTYQAWYGVPESFIDTARTFNPYTYPNQVDNYSQTHYQLHLNYAVSENLTIQASGFVILGEGYFEEYKGTEHNQVIGGSRASFADYGLPNVIIGTDTITETNLVRRRWLDNIFVGGIYNFTYTKNKLKLIVGGGYNEYHGDHFGEIIWAEYASNMDKNHRYYFNKGVKTDNNVYAKVSYNLSPNWSLFADLQGRMVTYTVEGVDNDQRQLVTADTLLFFNPKAGVSYKITDNSSAYVSLAMASHEPNRGDYIDAPTGRIPSPERLIDLEAGYRYAHNKWSLYGNFYHMQYQNQLVLTGAVNDVGSPIRQNVDNSYRMGLELELGYRITKNFRWSMNATVSKNKIASFTEYVDDWYNGGQIERVQEDVDIAFSPNIIGGSTFNYTFHGLTKTKKLKDQFNIALISKYVNDQYLDNTMNDARKLDAYFTNDVRFLYVVENAKGQKVSVNFTIRNLFNTLYVNNGWTYAFNYQEPGTGTPSYNPADGDPYTTQLNNQGDFQMKGLFPQAGFNSFLGLTVTF